MLEFLILGPLEINVAGTYYRLQGSFLITLLMTLLVNRSGTLSHKALLEELWGSGQPSRAQNALQAHVSRLRRKLNQIDGLGDRLVSTPLGYELLADPDEIDGEVFVRQVERTLQSIDQNSPHLVSRQLRATLTLWRGPVLGGLTGGSILQAAAARYEDVRLRAYESMFEAELRCSNHAAIIPELGAVLAGASQRMDRYCEQLMIALYRAGRQSDALTVYQQTRARLAADTDAPPSARLRQTERAILAQDPALADPAYGVRALQRP